MLQDVLWRKNPEACSTAEEAKVLEVCYQMSERRLCSVIRLQRSTYRYRSAADEQTVLRTRLRDLAQGRVSYGYRRLHILLQREGWEANHKRLYRLYRLEGLGMRPKKPWKSIYQPQRTSTIQNWIVTLLCVSACRNWWSRGAV